MVLNISEGVRKRQEQPRLFVILFGPGSLQKIDVVNINRICFRVQAPFSNRRLQKIVRFLIAVRISMYLAQRIELVRCFICPLPVINGHRQNDVGF